MLPHRSILNSAPRGALVFFADDLSVRLTETVQGTSPERKGNPALGPRRTDANCDGFGSILLRLSEAAASSSGSSQRLLACRRGSERPGTRNQLTGMSYENSIIGDLKRRRQEMGSSIKELGHNSGIDEKFLSDWECGVGSPRLDVIESWAAALGVRVAVLPANSGTASGLRVDWTKRNVAVGAVAMRLTPMEWKFLERLARAPGELVTHRELFHHLYGNERHYCAESTGIRVLVTKLRRLLRVQIEAKWRRGYVISGIEPSLPRASVFDLDASDVPAHTEERQPEKPQRDPAPIRRKPVSSGETRMRRPAVPPARERRAEELEMLDRFLAQRGATRCPDPATIQKSALPALAWDRLKRKWVRPSATEQEATRPVAVPHAESSGQATSEIRFGPPNSLDRPRSPQFFAAEAEHPAFKYAKS